MEDMQTLADKKDTYMSSDFDEAFKRCPFCAERIQLQAVKCRWCGEFLNSTPPPPLKPAGKWYYSVPALAAALLSLGPLALPLVWFNPRLKPWVKAAVSVGVVAFTIFLCWAMVRMYAHLMDQIRALGI